MIRKVSVLIVSYNVKEYVDHAIDSLMQSSIDNIEIVVIDNHSFDGTVDHIKNSYPDVNVISNKENVGFGKAVNQAANVANGDYFLILNPDTVVQENTIDILLKYLEQNDKVGIVGPKILNSDGTLQAACKRSFPTLKVAVPKL
ncbi:MAG TPA: glycosyl transferase, partial [Candidatus Marinimicrobia bacterium]|nr:glycosyl transferase [Candidatus Neomarinimicrobiota bacterium]